MAARYKIRRPAATCWPGSWRAKIGPWDSSSARSSESGSPATSKGRAGRRCYNHSTMREGRVGHPEADLGVTLDRLLANYRHGHSEICFLQVGAFDGVLGDPIYPLIEKYDLRGYLLEPQRDAFARLKANYARFAGD